VVMGPCCAEAYAKPAHPPAHENAIRRARLLAERDANARARCASLSQPEKRMFKTWFGLTRDAVLLGFETQRVIGLRLAKIAAGGPAAQVEAKRMVMEKTAALAEAATTLATGGSPRTVVRRYRTHVKANERRLSRVKSTQ
jgi:hypothetical protein